MRRVACGLLVLAAACTEDASGPEGTTGAISLHVELSEQRAGASLRQGSLRRALRAAAIPDRIARLQLVALDVSGSTLAETNLYADAMPGQLELSAEGGVWELREVPAGKDRAVAGHAYLPDGARAYSGKTGGIEVRAGEVADAGVLVLENVGPRLPELDFDAPDAPKNAAASAVAAGGALRVVFDPPPQDDLAGYVVAVASSSAAATPPSIARATLVDSGSSLAPGVRVAAAGAFTGGRAELEVPGLKNGVTYTVLIYAHDADLEGKPLNYSRAALAFGVPRDTEPPGRVRGLTITASTAELASIRFLVPMGGEPPAAYEVRASIDPDLLDGDAFGALPFVTPPDAGPNLLAFTRRFDELGATSTTAFYLGVRALDAAGNAGEITLSLYSGTPAAIPVIERVVPDVALASGEVSIRGRAFGAARGAVLLTATGTSADVFPLPISRWTDSEIAVRIPAQARSGVLSIRPASGGPSGETFLPVVVRIQDQAIRRCFPYTCSSNDRGPYPFELIGAGALDGSTTGALYRECCMGNGTIFESGVERVFGLRNENAGHGIQSETRRASAIAGTYSADRDAFLFVASDTPASMTSAIVSSDADAARAGRRPLGVGAGGADRVSVIVLDGGASGQVPAMIAFTLNGTIRTGTVADAYVQPFNAFYAISSRSERYDRVAIQRRSDGEVLMAYRIDATDGMGGELALRRNTQGRDPSRFDPIAAAARPRAGRRFEVLALPGASGPERFVIVYESIEAGGRRDVRILPIEDYGRHPGLLAFPPVATDRRLADAGLVMRGGRAWLAILYEEPRLSQSKELFYAEVPQAALQNLDQGAGAYAGLSLDIALDDSDARLGCKPLPQNTCPIAWLGSGVNVLFVRR